MKTLNCFIPSPLDATSLYRAKGPLETLARRMDGQLSLVTNPEASWGTMKSCDAIFMQRCSQEHHVRIADLAIANRKPIWADYDDDLFSVPPSNPTYSLYGNPKIQNYITSILAKADVLTVSTPALLRRFGEVLLALKANGAEKEIRGAKLDTRKIHVVPNAYDTEILDPLTLSARRESKPSKLVVWRGSGTHDKDLMVFTPAIGEVLGRHLDWTFNFIGQPFWWTIEELSNVPNVKPTSVVISPPIDPIDFFLFLKQVRPALMIVPLDDSPFNRAKSNIAWVEATHAGAVTLAPDWPEWQRPGILNYKNPADFQRILTEFVQGQIDDEACWHQSRDFIVQNLTLAKVNHIRELVFRNLVERPG